MELNVKKKIKEIKIVIENKIIMKMKVRILCVWMKNVEGGRKGFGVKRRKVLKIVG